MLDDPRQLDNCKPLLGHPIRVTLEETTGTIGTGSTLAWHGLPFWHGHLGRGQAWPAPKLVASEPQEARPGFSSCSADEYEVGRCIMKHM